MCLHACVRQTEKETRDREKIEKDRQAELGRDRETDRNRDRGSDREKHL